MSNQPFLSDILLTTMATCQRKTPMDNRRHKQLQALNISDVYHYFINDHFDEEEEEEEDKRRW